MTCDLSTVATSNLLENIPLLGCKSTFRQCDFSELFSCIMERDDLVNIVKRTWLFSCTLQPVAYQSAFLLATIMKPSHWVCHWPLGQNQHNLTLVSREGCDRKDFVSRVDVYFSGNLATTDTRNSTILNTVNFYLHDVVSAVYATATWLAVRHTPVLYQNG